MYWVTQARAYLIMIRGLFLFLIIANSTRLDPLLLDLVICMQATLEGPWVIRPIIIRSCDMHAGDIRGAMGEIASYHERD